MAFNYQEEKKEDKKRNSVKSTLFSTKYDTDQDTATEKNKTGIAIFDSMDEKLSQILEATELNTNLKEEIESLSKSRLQEASKFLEEEICVGFCIDATESVTNKNFGGLDGNDQKIRDAYDEFLETNIDKPIRITTNVYNQCKSDFQAVRCPIKEAPPLNYRNKGGTIFFDAACDTIIKVREENRKANSKSPTIVVLVADQDVYSATWEKSKRKASHLKTLIEETKKEGFQYVFISTNGMNQQLADAAASFGIDAKHIVKAEIKDFVQRFRIVTDIVNQIYLGSDEIYIRDNLEELMARNRQALGSGK
jgi:hypothetical protein